MIQLEVTLRESHPTLLTVHNNMHAFLLMAGEVLLQEVLLTALASHL